MDKKTGLHDLILKLARGDGCGEDEMDSLRKALTQYIHGQFYRNFSREDIQEIVAQSMLSIILHAGKYRGNQGEASAWVWAYMIARNQALKWLKTTKRETSLSEGRSSDPSEGVDSDTDEEVLTRRILRFNPDLIGKSVESQVDERLLIEKMHEIVLQLTPREKWILRKHFVEGQNFRQIAQRLGVKPPRVTQIMHGLLEKCRRRLDLSGFDAL